MPKRDLQVQLATQLASPPRIIADEDGKLSAELLVQLQSYLEELQTHVNSVSLGSGAQGTKAGHLNAQIVEFTAPSVADTQFTVAHGLGVTPTMVFVGRNDRAGELYDANPGGWGPRNIFFKSSVGSKLYKILIWG